MHASMLLAARVIYEGWGMALIGAGGIKLGESYSLGMSNLTYGDIILGVSAICAGLLWTGRKIIAETRRRVKQDEDIEEMRATIINLTEKVEKLAASIDQASKQKDK